MFSEELGNAVTELKEAVKAIESIKTRVDDLETSISYNAQRLEDVVKTMLPAMTAHMAQLTEGLAQQTLSIDVHRRKWNLVLHGLDGEVGEEEVNTRAKCVTFAKSILRVPDAEHTRFAACHRLSRSANAGIIIRFCDIAQRDRWLSGTKHLRQQEKRISLSPDLPPVLRPLKDELMLSRSKLSPELKAKSRVRYMPHWPYVELRMEGKQPQRPAASLSAIAEKILGLNPLFKIQEN